jgi:hypothetical protein
MKTSNSPDNKRAVRNKERGNRIEPNMNRGFFQTTNELMASDVWPLIECELRAVMSIEHWVAKPHGIIEIHGQSELFTIKPIEGSTPQYDCIFTDSFSSTKESKPKFKEFKPV